MIVVYYVTRQHKTFYTQTNIQACTVKNHKIMSESRVTKRSGRILEYRIFYSVNIIVWAKTIFWT